MRWFLFLICWRVQATWCAYNWIMQGVPMDNKIVNNSWMIKFIFQYYEVD